MKRILFILLLFIPLCLSGQVVSSTVSYSQEAEPYGPEMITDGTLDVGSAWSVTGGWSYDTEADNMVFDDATNGNLVQADGDMAFSILNNKRYKIAFDISIIGGGNANFNMKSWTGDELYVDYADYADGPHSLEFDSPVGVFEGGIAIRADENNCDAAFTIDNISIMEVF